MATEDSIADRARRIFVLYTGGTIGMQPSPRGYVPARGHLGRALEQMPSFHVPGRPRFTMPVRAPSGATLEVRYELEEFEDPLDSANMSARDWVDIARRIESAYDDHDAFVILHGTDTMAYTASALSFMLEGLAKTVILTGSQIPLAEVRSDARENLLGAMSIAAQFDIPEVGLYFRDRLWRGNRSRKVDAGRLDAFDAPNYGALAEVGIDIDVHARRVLPAPGPGVPFRVQPIDNEHVAALRLYPGMHVAIVENILRAPTRGVVLETYGSGNAPDRDPAFLGALRAATDRGVVLVNVTQCERGAVTGDYAAGRALIEAGVVPGGDMTPHAALTKLAWLLSRDMTPEQVRQAVARDLRGELTVRAPRR